MKKILFSFIFTVMMSNLGFSQASSITDEAYRSKILQFSYNLNIVLLTDCPQDVSLNELKNKIINGEIELSNNAKSLIHNYAIPLINYAEDFKLQKNLNTENNSELYFLSSFSPSTNIIDGKIIEITTKLNPNEMWYCALKSFKTDESEMKALVTDNTDIHLISKAATSYLTKNAGNTGVWIMLSGFSNCLDEYNNKFTSDNLLTVDDIINVREEIATYQDQNNINSIEEIPEEELKTILTPLIINGRQLHTEIMESISKINAFQELQQEDKEKIANISDAQAVEISVVFASTNASNRIPWDTIFACGGTALGLGGIRQIYNLLIGAGVEALGLGSVLTAIGTVAVHYVGIFAVASFIYGFVDCLT
jgi:hypothetical protein